MSIREKKSSFRGGGAAKRGRSDKMRTYLDVATFWYKQLSKSREVSAHHAKTRKSQVRTLDSTKFGSKTRHQGGWGSSTQKKTHKKHAGYAELYVFHENYAQKEIGYTGGKSGAITKILVKTEVGKRGHCKNGG